MFKGKRFLALIPARGGSKGLKDKNIRLLNNKPLLAYTIEAAKKSGIFDRIIVSTDSEKIAAVALKYGAEVPFMRPKELATDTASSMDVLIHTIELLQESGDIYDYVVLLQPTSPLRTSQDIVEAANLLIEKNANSVVSVCKVGHSPLWSNTLPEDLSLKDFIRPEIKNLRRQDLPIFYRLNGAIYIAKVSYILETKDFFGQGSYAYIMPVNRSVDIDTEFDLALAEVLLQHEKQ
ncbi:cytidylyltransferase domain-containing protein [Kosmotoga sp. DU53]|uniref:acylneuraminate cytidylyltransferase family protein n=1 Tax=Kosmotoga sp. DU53 TaxID=1310160 RepID=UPI0007C4908C|nr:acylneuraminate cytidylyltransferase family protein [Kosmotoga sp. DU53]OAA18901.1 CMP-N-acetlyneuraminic acid synthetase [Kosmotoga sp. DU53]